MPRSAEAERLVEEGPRVTHVIEQLHHPHVAYIYAAAIAVDRMRADQEVVGTIRIDLVEARP